MRNSDTNRPSNVPEPVWWRRRVVIVSDRRELAAEAAEQVKSVEGVPEVVRWREAGDVGDRVGAVLALVHDLTDEVPALGTWAARAWQPLTVVLLPQARGAARVVAESESLGFSCLLRPPGPPPWDKVRDALSAVVEDDAWSATWFAQALGGSSPEIVGVITAALARGDVPARPEAYRKSVRFDSLPGHIRKLHRTLMRGRSCLFSN